MAPYFLQQGQLQEALGQAGQLQPLQSVHSVPQLQAPPSLSEIWCSVVKRLSSEVLQFCNLMHELSI